MRFLFKKEALPGVRGSESTLRGLEAKENTKESLGEVSGREG